MQCGKLIKIFNMNRQYELVEILTPVVVVVSQQIQGYPMELFQNICNSNKEITVCQIICNPLRSATSLY